jgi:hypothetical protein
MKFTNILYTWINANFAALDRLVIALFNCDEFKFRGQIELNPQFRKYKGPFYRTEPSKMECENNCNFFCLSEMLSQTTKNSSFVSKNFVPFAWLKTEVR